MIRKTLIVLMMILMLGVTVIPATGLAGGGDLDVPDASTRTSTVRIVWNDEGYEQYRPSSVKVIQVSGDMAKESITVTKENNWQYTMTGLPIYDGEGKEIVHTWKLETVPGRYSNTKKVEAADFVTELELTYQPPVSYTVRFINADGTELQKKQADAGTVPVYAGSTPTKADDDDYHYAFSGWTDGTKNYRTTDELPAVTKDVTYTATFSAIRKVRYEVTVGEGAEYRQGSDGTLTFVFKRSENDEDTFDHFTGVKCDGKQLTKDLHYSASKGSVIITLKTSFLKTLSTGGHTLTAMFDDSDPVDVSFHVVNVPKTGDSADLLLWGGTILLAPAGFAAFLSRKARKR